MNVSLSVRCSVRYAKVSDKGICYLTGEITEGRKYPLSVSFTASVQDFPVLNRVKLGDFLDLSGDAEYSVFVDREKGRQSHSFRILPGADMQLLSATYAPVKA